MPRPEHPDDARPLALKSASGEADPALHAGRPGQGHADDARRDGARKRWGGRIARGWQRVLDLALILWVVRIPLASVGLGLLLMSLATQAQDVTVDIAMAGAPLAEAAGISGPILRLAAAIFLFWAVPVHYAARLLLDTDDGLAARLKARRPAGAAPDPLLREVPRVLGALPFALFALGAWKALANLPALDDMEVMHAARSQLVLLVWVMLACMPLFFLYAIARQRLIDGSSGVKALDTAAGNLVGPLFNRLGIAPRKDDPAGALHAIGRLGLFLYGFVVVVVLVASPLWLADRLPLALAVPLIFGGWVPILSYLSSLGRRLHAPLVSTLLLAGVVGTYLFGDNHAVRILAANEPAHRRATLPDGLFLWMRANGCADDPAACPRPVIVAAAGGASRAGFFTASVIGHFLDFDSLRKGYDFTRKDGSRIVRADRDDGRFTPAQEAVLGNADIAGRIFAISGVSGGAYGAAAVTAALSARTGPGVPPCAGAPAPYWFGKTVANWRDCLESLTAGDYLTATFFGLAFHDQVQLFLQDRAALLEQAWEQRAEALLSAPGAATAPRTLGRLAAPFLSEDRSTRSWLPFLVLNGTSVETGQRIVTTDLNPTYAAPRDCPSGGPPAECPVFVHTLDFHSLIRADLDVALSTAALNSARFPVISPPGSIHASTDDIADRIVDGGYFENYGAESALDLARAIVAVEPRLAPFVLVISNDPGSTYAGERGRRIGGPDAPEQVWFPEAAGPLGAIGTVRSGRGRLAVAETQQWLDERYGARCGPNMAHIKVWPQVVAVRVPAADGGRRTCPRFSGDAEAIRDISMSWWLSKPVQMNLREQLETPFDVTAACGNDAEVKAVWTALATPSRQCLAN